MIRRLAILTLVLSPVFASRTAMHAQQAQQKLLPLRLTPGLVSILRMVNWVALNEGIYLKNGLDVDQCMPQGDVDDLKRLLGIEAPTAYRCKPGGPPPPIGLSGGQPAFVSHFETNNASPRK